MSRDDPCPYAQQAGEAKRTKLYGKYGKLIVTAVKEGGGPDPVSNVQLGKVLADANRLSVPRELIERNIKRASDTKQADYVELTYEVRRDNIQRNPRRPVARARRIARRRASCFCAWMRTDAGIPRLLLSFDRSPVEFSRLRDGPTLPRRRTASAGWVS